MMYNANVMLDSTVGEVNSNFVDDDIDYLFYGFDYVQDNVHVNVQGNVVCHNSYSWQRGVGNNVISVGATPETRISERLIWCVL